MDIPISCLDAKTYLTIFVTLKIERLETYIVEDCVFSEILLKLDNDQLCGSVYDFKFAAGF